MGCSPLISSLCQLLLKPICHKGRGVGGEAKKGRDKSSGGTVGERGGGVHRWRGEKIGGTGSEIKKKK